MLYFFHHYELPVILQHVQLQQLLLRTHRGMAGMMGLAGIAAIASGAQYQDPPGTGIQATPPTTQSTTQTVQNTVQSQTQTTPSVSTVQTNTTHTGDVTPRTPETNTAGTNTPVENEMAILPTERNDKDISPVMVEGGNQIEEILRRDSGALVKESDSTSTIVESIPGAADGDSTTINVKVEPSTLDRRRNDEESAEDPVSSGFEVVPELATRASPEADNKD